ncbi:MAG: HAD hydrolase family protein [Cytophagaceae bacterium]|jgi:3-deoxy-D-manno-octulosonate 8-phosphate phosphatase (KDO 8-P phosphatase)|nr:HAD hydrolase family protein [Cytophagaceae bacterium]
MATFDQIRTFILDVDGVLTDGTLQAFRTGEQVRTFYVRDGYAIERALKAGYHILVISGGKDESVRTRLAFLGIQDVFLGVKDKKEVFDSYCQTHQLNTSEILYMGDDIPDLQMLRLVGMPTCPKDAAADILPYCTYISPYEGGRGAVRDVIEKVMRVQGKWTPELW